MGKIDRVGLTVKSILTFLSSDNTFTVKPGKHVNSRNISGMLLCGKKKANHSWENWTASKNVNKIVVLRVIRMSWYLLWLVITH